MGKYRGPRVNSMNLGSPWRETSKNWEKVMRLPDFGYSEVTRSRVRALLRAKVGTGQRMWGNGNNDEPAASTKYKTQGSDPFSRHLCWIQSLDGCGEAVPIEGSHVEIRPYRSR